VGAGLVVLTGAVVFEGGAEVGRGLLVAFAVEPAGKLELAGRDGSPVGEAVVLAGAVAPGPEVAGAVSFAALVMFPEGEAGAVPLADSGGVPLPDGLGEPVGAVVLAVMDGAVPLKEVGAAPLSEGPGEVAGAVPLPAEDGVAVPDAVVALPGNGVGAVVLPGAGAVAFVGSGSSKVVELSDTTMLVAVAAVPLVGSGAAGVVKFNGTELPVEAGTDTVALLGAIPEVGGGELAPVPDGGSAEAVPLPVGKGGGVVVDPGRGGKDVSSDGRGAKAVLELLMMMRLVAAADPLIVMVVTPVMAPTDEASLVGTEVEGSVSEGGGATTVVELTGVGAVSLVTMVVRLLVVTPGGVAVMSELVGSGAMTVVELSGTITLLAVAVPLTKIVETLPGVPLGLAVVFANGGDEETLEPLDDNDGGSGGVMVVTIGPGEGPEQC
jgi:hypothetical protein